MSFAFQLLIAIVDRNTESLLDEIQAELKEKHGVEVSFSTISRTLRDLGYTSKKVRAVDH